ncbi:MAG: DUF5320 domain-containing protein [Anaerolineales bacterium]|nr:DUF5320 domain-containing protein [Anaerolineales bacterium]
MPAFDGTGPAGMGPMTGRGEGYCAVAFPPPGTGRAPYGYAGLAGTPVRPVLSLRRRMRFVRGRGRGRGRRGW